MGYSMKNKLLLKNIRYLNPNAMRLTTGDIRIENNLIAEVGVNLEICDGEIVFAEGHHVILPGHY